MTTTSDIPISHLRAEVSGEVIAADDSRYEDARRVFFTGYDRRPAAIVRAADTQDVSRVVTLARETGARLAVRSGGHGLAGFGTTDGGIVLDLAEMNAVEVDPEGRTAWAQAGATTGAYTRTAGEHGLATGFGDSPTVGVGGITLSGGFGFLLRKHGLTIDDLLAAEVVTADGEILEVDAASHPELFWALRGGGGNFGVVTRLRFRLHEVDEVVGGLLVLPADAALLAELVFVLEAAPEELSAIVNVLKAPPLPFVPPEHHGKPVAMISLVHAGDAESGERALGPVRGLATPLADLVRPLRYPEMYAGPEAPRPALVQGTNLLLDSLPAGAADAILEHVGTASAPVAAVQLRVLGGAMARTADDATAFGYRGAGLMANVTALYGQPEDGAAQRAWVDGVAGALAGGAATPAYVGFLGDEGEDGLRRAYPPRTLERLARVKRRYDPDNLFRLNLNVPPGAR
ncbi:MAG TPA: FAD-binding oxidoreductase [Gaiellaceae bacterium]|nr:FAD-binding oxidoreductase [Gaiellaceae bacterium]